MLIPARQPESAPSRQSGPTRPPDRRTWLLAALLWFGTITLYWPAVHHDFVNYDDPIYVTANPQVQGGLTLAGIGWALTHPVCYNWHPLTVMSHMLDCDLYGLKPWGHHLTNVLLHALNTVLLFILLRRLTGATWRSAGVAAIFAWHPLHVESVAWVAERKDVLSTCLGFLTLLFYARYAEQSKAAAAFYTSRCYWLACVCFALGLMSKPMLVTWPLVLLLLDFWPLQRLRPGSLRALIIEKLPFFALAALASAVTFVVQKLTGAMRGMEVLPLELRSGNIFISYVRYLFKLVWPDHLAVFYPYPSHWPLAWVAGAGALLAAVSALAWVKRQSHPWLLMGWAWFVLTLVPVIGLVQVGIQSMADRYTYIPSVGVLIAMVWGACEFTRAWRHQTLILSLAGSAALLFCAILTHRQLDYWQDSVTLFQHSLKVTDDNYVARVNLGIARLDQGQTDQAITEFQQAIRLNAACAEAHNNLGNALNKSGQTADAMREFQAAIRLEPGVADPHNNLGVLLAAKGQTNQAIAEYQQAIQLDPGYVSAGDNLASLLAATGQTNEAIAQFERVTSMDPGDVVSRYRLGGLLAQTGQTPDAIARFEEIIRLKPDDAGSHNELGNLFAADGQTNEAINEFTEAIRLDPGDAEAHNNLGNLLAMAGRTDEAAGQFQEALRLKPGYANADFNFGNLLVRSGQADAAIGRFREALRLETNDPEGHYKLGNLLARTGQAGQAVVEFQEAINQKPGFVEARNNLGSLLMAQGRLDDAIQQFQEAVRLKPDYRDAHYNLANALAKKGLTDDAIGHYQAAIRLAPDFAPAHYYLGLTLAKKGLADEAIRQLQEAARLKPGDAPAHNQLGELLARRGRLDEAVKEFQQALRLQPDYPAASNNLARTLELSTPGK